MKNSLFLLVLAAAMLGKASAYDGTICITYDEVHSDLPGHVYGSYAEGGSNATGGRPEIYEDDEAVHQVLSNVYGGYTTGWGAAKENTVTMHGGTVSNLYGGRADGQKEAGQRGNAIDNTAVIEGGRVNCGYGGYSAQGEAGNNTLVIQGGSTNGASSVMCGGCTGPHSSNVSYNVTGNVLIVCGGDVHSPSTAATHKEAAMSPAMRFTWWEMVPWRPSAARHTRATRCRICGMSTAVARIAAPCAATPSTFTAEGYKHTPCKAWTA